MHIRLLLFALYRDLAGVEQLTLEVPDGSTARAAFRSLRGDDPRFAAFPENPVLAINREYVPGDAPLSEGDELALLPPVAGG